MIGQAAVLMWYSMAAPPTRIREAAPHDTAHALYTNDCNVPILSVNRVTQLLLYYLIRLPLSSRCARHATPPPTTPRGEERPADYRHKRPPPTRLDETIEGGKIG